MNPIDFEAKEETYSPWFLAGLAGVVVTLGLLTVAAAEHSGTNVVRPAVVKPASYTPNPRLEGRLAIAGSDTMRPLLTRLVGDFLLQHPKVKIGVESLGSSQAIREFIIGISEQRRGDKQRGRGHEGAAQVKVLASSREMTAEELSKFSSRFGHEPMVISIALDAVAVYVHKSNPLKRLTLEQVDAIFSSTHKRSTQDVTAWGQLGLDGMGNQPIHLYGRDKRSGTHDFFQTMALGGGTLKTSVIEEPGSASEVLAIARDPLGIGYAGVGFAISDVRMIPLAKEPGRTGIVPTMESVADGSYPLSRPLYLYVNHDPKGKFDAVLLEFLNYVTSTRGQEIVVSAKAYPLPQGVLAKNLALLSAAVPDVGPSGTGSTSEGIEAPVL